MTEFSLDDVSAALQETHLSPTGVSFEGKSLKLDTEADAQTIVIAINQCPDLQYLNLEGNTLGVDAAEAISKALEKHPEFKQALWKDMFTGRMKTEIPLALEHLGNGLITSRARLTKLDLSDNAFGPIGVKGLASLLKSPCCFALEELYLNNNGLGITGGKLLAEALLECHKNSQKEGKPLALKAFIAGRNRLENDGAKALAEVFKTIGTLEEIAMPQNGIYHAAITVLSAAFSKNPNLQILNLNDNTIGPKGAVALAGALPHLPKLKNINFGDCLLKTKGLLLLASALKHNMVLEELELSSNEINSQAALQLINAMSDKSHLKHLGLNANQFGKGGRTDIKNKLKEIGKINSLGSLSDDESEESEDDNDSNSEETSEDEETHDDETAISFFKVSEEVKSETNVALKSVAKTVSVSDFIATPTAENFLALGDDKFVVILTEVRKDFTEYLEQLVLILMKVSSLGNSSDNSTANAVKKCSEQLYKEYFAWAEKVQKVPIANNLLLVHLGLLKSEEKKLKITWNIESCLNVLESVITQNYVPSSTKDSLKVFFQRDISNKKEFLEIKQTIFNKLS